MVQIWRAVPRQVDQINPGDWVAISPEHAAAEAQRGDHVITARVRADQLWTEGVLEEWGYQGENPVRGRRDGTVEARSHTSLAAGRQHGAGLSM